MEKLTVFYDGACHLCHREVVHYKKKDSKSLLNLVDISQTDFNAHDFGLDPEDVQINMHSKSENGEVFKGVDTFIEIWKRIPPFHLLIPIFENHWLRPTINFGYKVFAVHIRPRLPKRKCEDGACEIKL